MTMYWLIEGSPERTGEEGVADPLRKRLLTVVALALDRPPFAVGPVQGNEVDPRVLGVVDRAVLPLECLLYRADLVELLGPVGVVPEEPHACGLVFGALLPFRDGRVDNGVQCIKNRLHVAPLLISPTPRPSASPRMRGDYLTRLFQASYSASPISPSSSRRFISAHFSMAAAIFGACSAVRSTPSVPSGLGGQPAGRPRGGRAPPGRRGTLSTSISLRAWTSMPTARGDALYDLGIGLPLPELVEPYRRLRNPERLRDLRLRHARRLARRPLSFSLRSTRNRSSLHAGTRTALRVETRDRCPTRPHGKRRPRRRIAPIFSL